MDFSSPRRFLVLLVGVLLLAASNLHLHHQVFATPSVSTTNGGIVLTSDTDITFAVANSTTITLTALATSASTTAADLARNTGSLTASLSNIASSLSDATQKEVGRDGGGKRE